MSMLNKNTIGDYVTVRIYNTGYADIITEHKTTYTDKENAFCFIALAKEEYSLVAYKRYENNDQVYWFN